MIELKSATKNYSKEKQIGPINLMIPKAGITSLIGPNGAGKSTMLSMMGRLISTDYGQINVGNYDVISTPSEVLAKVLGILRQENHFVTRLTVRQLVSFGRYPYSKGRITQQDELIISKYIDLFGLNDLANSYLNQLSGGQKQIAYVAMALCQETPYVLLDEPLNNLDIARSVQMMQHLRWIADEFSRTIVIVLHDINFAATYSDYICAMKMGKIAHFGPTEAIMQTDILSNIFGTPVEVIKGPNGPMALY